MLDVAWFFDERGVLGHLVIFGFVDDFWFDVGWCWYC